MTQTEALNRDLTVKTPKQSGDLKPKKNSGLNTEKIPVNARSFDVKKAFDLATKGVKKGVVSPSKFGLQKFVQKEFGVIPQSSDLIAWQKRWMEMGLIEPTAKNGKYTYKLLVVPE